MKGGAAEPPLTEIDGIKVVKEIDVYICNGSLGAGSELYDFEYPLRPAWRGYRVQEMDTVKIKPKAKRVEFSVPVGEDPRNIDERHPRMAARGRTMALRSQHSKPEDTYAVGFLQGGETERLYLMPLDHCMQMRPSFQYMEKDEAGLPGRRGRAAAANREREEVATSGAPDANGAGPSAPREDRKPEAVAVQVQVKKRETERQLEMRLNSYAHIKQLEDEEPWRDLEFCLGREGFRGAMEHAAARVDREGKAYASVSASTYMDDLAPILFSQFSGQGDAPRDPFHGNGLSPSPTGAGDAPGRGGGGGGPSGPAPTHFGPTEKGHFVKFVSSLLEAAGVLSLANIKETLAQRAPEHLKGLGLERMPDKALSEALLEKGSIVCIRRSYLLKRLGNPALDPFRDLVVELLQEKDGIRKNDVKEAAVQRNLEVNDALYGKVMKELCTSRGAVWNLKTGSN